MAGQSDKQWYEPDGTPATEGQHAHYAIWDHEGRKWDWLDAEHGGDEITSAFDEAMTRVMEKREI